MALLLTGYLERTFQTLSTKQQVNYRFFNKCVVGDGPEEYATQFLTDFALAQYVTGEIQTANSFHNPNVTEYNLLEQMENYIVKNHQTIAPPAKKTNTLLKIIKKI